MDVGMEHLTDLLEASNLAESNRMLFMKAQLLEDAGNYREALKIYRTVLEKQICFSDLQHEIVATKFRMAIVLYFLNEYEEALPMFEDLYSTMKDLFGHKTRFGLLAKGYLANILRKSGKDALPVYMEIYEIMSKTLPHASDTLTTRINIALELCDRDKYDESIKIFDEMCTLHILIKSDQKKVWSTLTNKSFVLGKQGNFTEALFIAKFLHESKKGVLGENHPETVMHLRFIGLILADQSEYDQAVSTMKAVISKQVMQNDEKEIVQNKWFLALILQKHGKFEESLSLLKELYAILKEKPCETITLLTSKLLVKILDQQGIYEEALHLYIEVQEMDKPDSDYLLTIKNIKRLTDQQRDSKLNSSSEELYELESKRFCEICDVFGKHIAEYSRP